MTIGLAPLVLFQAIVDGLIFGAAYALTAVGLTLIFGVMRVINFAHGEYFMLGAYTSFFFLTLVSGNYYLSILAAVVLIALIGALSYSIIFKPLLGKGRLDEIVIATFGLSLFLKNFTQILFGAKPKYIGILTDPFLRHPMDFGFFIITFQRILLLVGSISSFIFLILLLRYTRVGKGLRAVSQNMEVASMLGINSHALFRLSLVISVAFAALASVLVGPMFSINPHMGAFYLLKSFIITVVGGMGNLKGAFVTSFALGITESIASVVFPFELKDIFSFALVSIILYLRPRGLFGER